MRGGKRGEGRGGRRGPAQWKSKAALSYKCVVRRDETCGNASIGSAQNLEDGPRQCGVKWKPGRESVLASRPV